MSEEPRSGDPYNLRRFIDAQEKFIEQVRTELRQGRKQTHWMWFIFPQIQGLGSSPMAQEFAISSLQEARAYLEKSHSGTTTGGVHAISECNRRTVDFTHLRLSRRFEISLQHDSVLRGGAERKRVSASPKQVL